MLGETPVIFNRFLAHGAVPRVYDGRVYAHCPECLQASVDSFNQRFAIVNTAPTCLLELVDRWVREEGRNGG